jgi:hypothetical protein
MEMSTPIPTKKYYFQERSCETAPIQLLVIPYSSSDIKAQRLAQSHGMSKPKSHTFNPKT